MIQNILEIATFGTALVMSCFALWLMVRSAVPKGDDSSSAGHKRMLRARSFPY